MKSMSLKLLVPLLLVFVLTGCAGLMSNPQPLTFTPEGFPSGMYTAKADNFQILFDASQTMGNGGGANFVTAKNFVNAVNWSLPSDFGANMGLRTYGHSEQQSKALTELVSGMAKYSRDDMKKGLEKIKFAGGNSPLGAAIDAASADFEKTTGTAVLVIVSDGTQNNMDDPVASAKKIKAKMGDRLCIYTVWIGDDAAGKKLLESVATAGGCGYAENASALTEQKAFAAYVEKVFLNRKPAAPAQAPPVPPPVVVTPQPKEVITFNLLFDLDKSVIRADMVPMLEQAKAMLSENSGNYVVAGHTCSLGADAYNQGLSERRAAAVKKWLVEHGIAAGRLDSVGYGETQPKYDNKNEDGRKLNRRAEIRSK